MKRTAFFISDSTGITAETLGRALLTQFPGVQFKTITIPYVNSTAKAEEVCRKINQQSRKDQVRSLVFSTLAKPEIRKIVADCDGMFMDFFDLLVDSLETELQSKYAKKVGGLHNMPDVKTYDARIAAVDYALNNDDGLGVKNYKHADVILLGISRSGKTPTCLYLALKFGILAANYPLTEEDLLAPVLPKTLVPFKKKLFGLIIAPERLHEIREQRQPNSSYASLAQCKKEVQIIEQMFKVAKIPYLDSTSYSIEELATQIVLLKKIERQVI